MTRAWLGRAGRCAAAATVLAGALALAATRGDLADATIRIVGGASPPVPRAAPPNGAGVAKGQDSLRLLSQTTWVGPGQTRFRLQLKVTASDEANEKLAVNVYGSLTARSQFQAALDGYFSNIYYPGTPVPLSQLPRDPTGGLDVDIPVNDGSDSLPLTTTGVYPVQAFLERSDGVRAGAALTVFLVYAGSDARELRRLNVGLVVPLASKVPVSLSGVPGPVPGWAVSVLRADTAALARWHVPVAVEADAATLEALAKEGGQGSSVLAGLRSAVVSGDELLPTTDLPVDLPALVSSGFDSYLRAELSDGANVLQALLGASPSLGTWAFGDGIDTQSVAALTSMGASELVLPESELSVLPQADQVLTFAQPTELAVPDKKASVIGADAELSERVSQASAPGQAVLVGNQVLAELAMVDLEAPGDTRGVVLLPSPATTVNATFLRVFLSGLEDNPLLRGTTLAEIFREVPLASGSGTTVLIRQLESRQAVGALGGAVGFRRATGAVAADADVYGAGAALVTGLDQELSTSLSSSFSVARRSGIIGDALQAALAALHRVHLPPSTSITLTSRRGRLPLTLMYSSAVPAHVLLVLRSVQLSFVTQRFPEGTCQPVEQGSERCLLSLDHATTLQVPVIVRAPGAFPLSLEVESPSGAVEIASGIDTVRATAIPYVGVVLMVGAALFLGVWWVRNARHGRRAKRLVPRPQDDEPDVVRVRGGRRVG